MIKKMIAFGMNGKHTNALHYAAKARRIRRAIQIPANFTAGGHCNNITEIQEPCHNNMPYKRLGTSLY